MTALEAAAAQSLASYAGFDSGVWGASAEGHPILKTLPVYIVNPGFTSNPPVITYGDDERAKLYAVGLQWSASPVSLIPAEGFSGRGEARNATGQLNAGGHAARAAFSSDYYGNLAGAFSIAPKTLALPATNLVQDKVYDGTTSATLVDGVETALRATLVGDENLTFHVNARFARKDAGNYDVPVTVTLADGNGENAGLASNYNVLSTATSRAAITPKALSAEGFTVADKVYDGSASASAAVVGAVTGILPDDPVTVGAVTGQFDDALAGEDKPVSIVAHLTGAGAGNYTLTGSATGRIAPRPVEIEGATTATGSVEVAASGLQVANRVSGDNLALSGSVTLEGAAPGVQGVTGFSNLLLDNTNYTTEGATGRVALEAPQPYPANGNLPTGFALQSGEASESVAGNAMTIAQESQKAVIHWDTFDIGAGYSVAFDQKHGAAAVALNRVTGGAQSLIDGALTAPGQVFILNSAGVLFNAGSSVNAGALVASTLDMRDSNFLAGNYLLENTWSGGRVEARGVITVAEGGYAALVSGGKEGSGVTHTGTTTAKGGALLLAGGEDIRLLLDTDTARLSGFEAATQGEPVQLGGTLDISSENGAGGVLYTTHRVGTDDDLAVESGGKDGQDGRWKLETDGYVLGELVSRALELVDVEVASRENDMMVNDAIAWDRHTLTLSSPRNILVNAVLTATGTASFAANHGTGTNARGAYLGSPYGLYMGFGALGSSGGNDVSDFDDLERGVFAGKIDFSSRGTVRLNGDLYTVIYGREGYWPDGVLAMNANPDGRYVLGSDIHIGDDDGRAVPIGTAETPFAGSFEGFGHVIDNLHGGGLFGQIGATGSVSNFGVQVGSTILGNTGPNSGILADVNQGRVTNSFAGGLSYLDLGNNYYDYNFSVWPEGKGGASGGLVGVNHGLITGSYAYAHVGRNRALGGLVGTNETGGRIINSFALSDFPVNSIVSEYVGGLVGINKGEISGSFSDSEFIDGSSISYSNIDGRAGFVGWNTSTGVIENAWSNAIVAGDGGNGAGFVAINDGLVRNAYATGTVGEGPNQFGNGGTMGRFLAGFVYTNTGVIENAYTTAQILTENNATYGKPERSAFAHENTGTIINAYWDKTLVAQGATDSARAADGDTIADHTGDTNGSAAVGLSAANAKLLASYVGFDPAFWGSSLNGHPILKTLPVVASATVVGEYGATPSTATLATRGLQWGDTAASLLAYAPDAALLSASGFLDAGVYDLAQVFSWPSLYDDVSGALLIAPRRLTLAQTGIARGKTYDGDTAAEVAASAANGGLVGLVGGETLGVAYVDARFKDKNAGENKAVRFAAVRLADGENGGQAANYTIARKPLTDAIVTTLADIAPREISASYAVSDKVYDGDTTARVTAQDLAGLVAGDEVRALATGQFADAHAETGKAVAITASLQGGDAANYRLLPAAAGVASIAARPLELQAVLASGSEPYVVNASDITILNRVGEDDVGLAGSGVVTAGAVGEHDMALNNLGVANPDYTLAGATGKALVGDALLPHTPSGADYTAGRVTVSTSGNTMTVDQSVDRALINWMGFSIGVGHAVDFVQPGQGAVTLNRVTGSEKSLIAGAITAPGQVYIINPRGVLFTGASSVDVGALVAATQDIADADFMAGVLRFGVIPGAIPGVEQAGGIEAHGSITTGENGYVALLGNTITHRGATTAPGGAIALVGGSDITLTLDTTTGALRDVWAGNDGNDASALRVGGKLDVASVTGEAGRILTQGGLALEGGTRIDATGEDGAAGVWRLARAGDFRVDGEDENATTRGETLTRLLETLDVHVESKTGDVNVEDAIQWNKNTLTLAAARNVNIGDTLRVTDAGNLTAFYGESSIRADKNAPGIILGDLDARLYGVNMAFAKYADGTDADRFAGKVDFSGSGELKMGVAGKTPNTYTVIDSIAGLQAIDTNLAGFYALGRDLDLTGIDWTPLGALEGSLDGLGHVIHNLASTRGGLFNSSLQAAVQMNALSDFYDPSKGPDIPRPVADQPKISNLGLADISLIVQNPSGFAVGGLSNAYYGIAENDFVTGEIIVTKDVAGHSSVGGMFGKTGTVNQGGVSIVANSYAKVDIHADGVFYVGGFVGATDESYITNSYAAGNVDGGTGVFKGPSGAPVQGTGGFVGQNAYNSIISRSHAYGDVTGVGQVGGFVGVNQGQAAILGSSASGHAHLADMGLLLGGYDPAYGPSVGGFAGWNYHGSIQNSSSSGLVTSGSSAEGGGWVGGFAGYTHVDHDGTSFSYGNVFDKDTAGVDHDGGGNGVLPMGNHHHDGGGSGTPILDAYNAKYGTNLTPEQFHAGAVGVSSGEFAAIQQQQATDPGAAAKAYETALNSATGGNTGGNPGDNTGGNTGHNSGDNTGGNTGTPGTGTGETEGAGTDGTGGTGTDGTGTGETGGAGADGTGIGGTEPGGIAEPGASPGNTGDASGSAPGDTGGAGTQPTAAEDARAISANIQQESAARAQAAAFRSGAGFGLSFGDNAPPVAENLRILDQNYVADVEDIEIDGRRFDLRDCDTPQDETCKK
ncbi:MAG: YDG domain-containing protein [Candidatus Accumulibacter sp.]|nr:YDG domain-containing protein [Accumulibacter sp.]